LKSLGSQLVQPQQVASALQIASSLQGYQKADTLAEIALKLAQAGRYDQAQQFAQTLTDSSEKATTLVDIAVIAATAGQYDQAIQIAEVIANDSYKVLTLANIASQEIKAGQTDKASEILNQALGIIPSLSL
jgi:tetratricopeptide (TPR) repeat protein